MNEKSKSKTVSVEGLPKGDPRYLNAGRFFCGGVAMKVQDINSAAIRAFIIEAGRDEADMIGIYDHPDHIGDNDWRITLYECGGRVAAGNGGAIFEEADPEQFANLIREYGIE